MNITLYIMDLACDFLSISAGKVIAAFMAKVLNAELVAKPLKR